MEWSWVGLIADSILECHGAFAQTGQATLLEWNKEVGVTAAKDTLPPGQCPKLRNQSEEKVVNIGAPAAEFAHKLLHRKESVDG